MSLQICWCPNHAPANSYLRPFERAGAPNSKYNFLALSALSGTILINEIEADPQGGGPDWIEIFNKGSIPHDVTGMEIVDSKRSHRFVVGASPICTTIIPPRGFLVILGTNGEVAPDSRLAAAASNEAVCRFQFGLDRNDDSVHLLAGKRTPPGIRVASSWGRGLFCLGARQSSTMNLFGLSELDRLGMTRIHYMEYF